jgi:hypothetical protein
VARLAQRRAARRHLFAAFPDDGRWRSADGAMLTASDWQSPESHTLAFSLGALTITIDRLSREVRWDEVL